MKIIICCNNLYGGGAERVASLWAKGFYDRGDEVYMFLAENNIAYEIPNIPITIIGNNLSTIKQYFCWYKIFKKEFRRIKPDIFISVNHPWAIIAKAAAFGKKLKVVSTEHNAYEKPKYIKMGFSDKLHKFVFNKFVDKVSVITNADKDYIGTRLNNVYVLPNPLTFEPITTLPSKEKIILAVGRLDAWHVKGFDLLVKAWKDIAFKYPDWKLKIIGGGLNENKSYIQSIAKDIDSAQFEIADFDNNIIEQYKKASIFILSSRYEGFGMVLIEAMSQGCGCIACDYKGRQKEIVTNGIDGIVIESNISLNIISALEMLLSDNILLNRIQNNAIKRSKDFLLYKIIDRWNSILDID